MRELLSVHWSMGSGLRGTTCLRYSIKNNIVPPLYKLKVTDEQNNKVQVVNIINVQTHTKWDPSNIMILVSPNNHTYNFDLGFLLNRSSVP